MRTRFLLGAALAALLLTACQPSASPSPSDSGPASGEPLPSFVGDQELEDTIPTSVDGLTFLRVSMSGPDFIAEDVDQRFLDFIDALDADIDEVSVAVGLGTNLDGDRTASIFAFRVRGAEAANLVDQFKATADANADPLVWHPDTIGGKDVEVAEPNDDFPTPIALYAVGDVLYFVSASDQDAFEAIIAELP
jgi:hypothetical protein